LAESDRDQPCRDFETMAGAINSHDVIALTTLMAADHVFVDSLGNRVRGARSMEAGWRGYFAMCPDYWIRTDDVMAADDTVSAAGEAGGTIDGESWRVPAAWKAVVRDGSGGNGRYLRTTNRFTRFWGGGGNRYNSSDSQLLRKPRARLRVGKSRAAYMRRSVEMLRRIEKLFTEQA